MTARCYPEQVHERDGRIGEVHVWRLLRDALPDDAVLMYSVHVPVGWDGFFADEDEFYSTVSSFKGLERACVVLAVNGFNADAHAKEMLYVGLSRARSQLVVVGDLDEIAEVGGPAVRHRLQHAQPWQPG